MVLPPIFYHYFELPLPYLRTLALQERIHEIQLLQRKSLNHKDVFLLLQHRPVYTTGRRQTEDSVRDERLRLTSIGADFVTTKRGGQLTYHGPGQIVGYPLLDLSRYSPTMGIRDYVCRMQKMLEGHLLDTHGLQHIPSEHTGVFLDAQNKIASVGVQVRHRLTSHGFAMNISKEPTPWFDRIVACGLDGVKAGSIEGATSKPVGVKDEIPALVRIFGQVFERDMTKLENKAGDEVGEAILAVEEEARTLGGWATAPS